MVQGIARNDAQARRLCGDLLSQFRMTMAWLREVEGTALGAGPVGPRHSLRDIVGHLLLLATEVSESTQSATTRRPGSLASHLRAVSNSQTRIHEMTRQLMGADTTAALIGQLARAVEEMERGLHGELPPIVETSVEPLRITDLVKARTVELVQFSDDLSEVLPTHQALPLDPGALLTSVRVLAEVLAAQRPGHSVEVRVPPAVAVQIAGEGGGPTHTRGTPPAVVEMDSRTFLRLATGRTQWDDAVEQHLVSASGVHANLAPALPVVRI